MFTIPGVSQSSAQPLVLVKTFPCTLPDYVHGGMRTVLTTQIMGFVAVDSSGYLTLAENVDGSDAAVCVVCNGRGSAQPDSFATYLADGMQDKFLEESIREQLAALELEWMKMPCKTRRMISVVALGAGIGLGGYHAIPAAGAYSAGVGLGQSLGQAVATAAFGGAGAGAFELIPGCP